MCTNIKHAVMDEGNSKGQRVLENLQEHLTTKDCRKGEWARATEDTHRGRTIGRGRMYLHLVGDLLSTLLPPSTSSITALSSVWAVRPNRSIRFEDVINSNRLPLLASFWLLCDEVQVMGQGSHGCATSFWENILGITSLTQWQLRWYCCMALTQGSISEVSWPGWLGVAPSKGC
jgi:hypothetical protein